MRTPLSKRGAASLAAHAASHQDGGGDEINVGGLSGLLADAQTPAAHTHTHASTTGQTATDHHDNSSDPTADEKAALAGTGTPSAGDVYVNDSDSRMSDARTPTAHTHTHASTTGQTATDHHDNSSDPTADEKAALAGTGTPSAGDVYVNSSDGRMSDARTPTAHASAHADGGGDEISVTGLSGLLADAQKVSVEDDGTAIGTRKTLNFTGAGVTVTDDAPNDEIDIDIPGVSGGLGYCMDWGGNVTGGDTSKFVRSDGQPAGSIVTGLNPESERTIPKAGNLNRLAWNSETADGTTIIKVHKNASVVETLTLSGAVGTIAMTTSVALGDEIAIEYDAGTAPGKSNWMIYVE